MHPHQALRLLSLAGVGALAALPTLAQEGRYLYGVYGGLSGGGMRSGLDESAFVAGRLPAGTR